MAISNDIVHQWSIVERDIDDDADDDAASRRLANIPDRINNDKPDHLFGEVLPCQQRPVLGKTQQSSHPVLMTVVDGKTTTNNDAKSPKSKGDIIATTVKIAVAAMKTATSPSCIGSLVRD